MKISCVQFDATRASHMDPFAYCASMIEEAAKEEPDVIVLPEKWNVFGPPETHRDQADEGGERTRKLLSKAAKEYAVNIVGGSVAERRDGAVYNTAHVFDRKGEEVAVYDKVHLYQDGIERDYYAAGNEIGLFELDGVPCGVVICYDMNFPEWLRCYGLSGVDVLFVPAAWPSKWMRHLELVQCSRALENQCYLACAGFCKSNGDGTYRSGGTAIVGPHAEFLVKADHAPGVYTAEVSREFLKKAREWQHFLKDRREDLYRRFGF
ncbi:MAG: nitrilase-related carbon-nitrogen hydrolase [Peptoniphilus sp.]|nr:nitrilase-related carbon-nitrogen hydrolase [Peptoniphilus sp.]MDD7363029.1 carbon-nitrogen family hydrolase [Bacillota bacterium]MDY6045294.1 nitrilase-related carbon-nitrogen hydrolase [Peptoniphilus sp.]